MTLPNRINPWGQFVATTERGTRMGNRGILHELGQGEAGPVLKRQWAHQAWVCCVLAFKDRKRAQPWSTPNTYSELFFLDEATALAAGHRPCFECQRERADEFKRAWLAAHAPGGSVSATAMNARLHAERQRRNGKGHEKPVYTAQLGELPAGAMFALGASAQPGDAVWLRAEAGCRPWSFSGYGAAQALAADTPVTVLTPASIVAVLRHGYVPQLHGSAFQ